MFILIMMTLIITFTTKEMQNERGFKRNNRGCQDTQQRGFDGTRNSVLYGRLYELFVKAHYEKTDTTL